jgi:hypothetical protein
MASQGQAVEPLADVRGLAFVASLCIQQKGRPTNVALT